MAQTHDRRSQTDVASVLMAEVGSLREEIGRRSEAQHTIINLDITAVGAITGFVLTQGHGMLMLMLPFITSALGLLFFDHANNIDRIGRHIENRLWPKLQDLVGTEELPNYQEKVAENELKKVPRTIYAGALVLMFA